MGKINWIAAGMVTLCGIAGHLLKKKIENTSRMKIGNKGFEIWCDAKVYVNVPADDSWEERELNKLLSDNAFKLKYGIVRYAVALHDIFGYYSDDGEPENRYTITCDTMNHADKLVDYLETFTFNCYSLCSWEGRKRV